MSRKILGQNISDKHWLVIGTMPRFVGISYGCRRQTGEVLICMLFDFLNTFLFAAIFIIITLIGVTTLGSEVKFVLGAVFWQRST